MKKYLFIGKIILSVWISVIVVLGFTLPMAPLPSRWYELPLVPGLEQKARIIFFHVPMAWIAALAFLSATFYGIRYLQTKKNIYDLSSVAAAGLGTLFCILATATGSLWAKFNWGSFWNWDPRETSIFVLLLIYGAYFALRSSVDAKEKRAKLSAAYSIIAGATAPFFLFIMPRITSSLHPGSTDDVQGSTPVAQLKMPPNMLLIFFASIAGFTLLYYWIFYLSMRLYAVEEKQLINERNDNDA